MSNPAAFERVVTSPDALKDRMVDAFLVAKALMESGKKVHIVIKEGLDPIGARQRKFYKDVVCAQIAEQVVMPDRGRFTKAIWAEYFRDRILGSRFEPMPDGSVKEIANSTEEVGSVHAYADFTDSVIAIATMEFGVHFVFEMDQREQTRPHSTRRPAG